LEIFDGLVDDLQDELKEGRVQKNGVIWDFEGAEE
jgi:hypothetical protein